MHGDQRQPGSDRGAVQLDHGPDLGDDARPHQRRPRLLSQARDSTARSTHTEGGLLLGTETQVMHRLMCHCKKVIHTYKKYYTPFFIT